LQLHSIQGWEMTSLSKLNDKKQCENFLSTFFPKTIRSSAGVDENPIAYVLRHTQLIPRHIIVILNQVHNEQKQNGQNGKLIYSESALKNGVERKINEITEDIIIGYREKYPNLQQILEVIIPNLPLHFEGSDMDSQYPRHVKVLHKRHPKIIEYAIDATSLLRTLLDVGIVGRAIGDAKESEMYIKAEFSYTIPSRDVGYSSEKDRFCFHPVFAKRFRCIYDPAIHKPVYPIGTDPKLE